MPPAKSIHQVFLPLERRDKLEDYPLFARSQAAFRGMRGWDYRTWDEPSVDELCQARYPGIWGTYRKLPYPIQRVDLAKYMILDTYGGFYADLDVIPKCHLSELVGDQPYLFDWCSRKNVIANDLMYVREPNGLPGIFDYFLSNLRRLNSIPAYRERRMRFVFHSTGPDFWTRYVKKAGLGQYVDRLSNRSFADPKQAHRNVRVAHPKFEILHQLSWKPQVKECAVSRVERSIDQRVGAPVDPSASGNSCSKSDTDALVAALVRVSPLCGTANLPA